MPRTPRVDIADYYYHVLNRAVDKTRIFKSDKDYLAFENILEEAHKKFDIDLFAYCIMPNHWHLVLSPNKDGLMQKYMKWVTGTHVSRWRMVNDTIGYGHLYQGRYKSNICQDDYHLPTIIAYVERNPKKAGLVQKAEDWRWGSLWRRINGTNKHKKILSDWPIAPPDDYLDAWINNYQINNEEQKNIDIAIKRGSPFGDLEWRGRKVRELGLESTIRKKGGRRY